MKLICICNPSRFEQVVYIPLKEVIKLSIETTQQEISKRKDNITGLDVIEHKSTTMYFVWTSNYKYSIDKYLFEEIKVALNG